MYLDFSISLLTTKLSHIRFLHDIRYLQHHSCISFILLKGPIKFWHNYAGIIPILGTISSCSLEFIVDCLNCLNLADFSLNLKENSQTMSHHKILVANAVL